MNAVPVRMAPVRILDGAPAAHGRLDLAAPEADVGQHARVELAKPANREAPPPLGGKRASPACERLDQAAPPRAPPIRCKRKRNKGYGSRNNETAHPVLLGSRLPTSGRMPRPPLATLGGSSSTHFWSRMSDDRRG
jgi:hypothetical protein